MADPEAARPATVRTIGEHGIIGDLNTAALVAIDGTVDYMCWPNLDSPTIFAGLLDAGEGGVFELRPEFAGARTLQLYLPDTNVLVTRWLCEQGSAEVIDLMPHPDAASISAAALVRRARVTRGTVRFTLRCRPRFAYARVTPAVRAAADGIVFEAQGSATLRLSGPVAFQTSPGEAAARFELESGAEATFLLMDVTAELPSGEAVERAIDDTVLTWRTWAKASTYRGRWQESVTRSALLTSQRHGSIAAAATFGLPEAVGEGRNWDYRATWIRDASFTVYAFMRLGYVAEAESFRTWLAKRVEGAHGGRLRIMYALDGSEAPDETALTELAGYLGSKPVRIGNAAREQTQLDIYGELMDSVYLSNKYGSATSREGWLALCSIVELVGNTWNSKDAGIWEFRDRQRHLLHSRLMCWVALDRAIRLANKRSLPAPLARWIAERDRISADIWTNFRHPERGYFVQEKDGTELDAALLMMPLVRFVSATDPVWLATLEAIGASLSHDGLIYRYNSSDGVGGEEGAFTTCTFWYVECLARAGRVHEAHLLMNKALQYANHLGLFSEELDRLGRPLGNFPQALTHLALISAAHFLNKLLEHPGGGEWQP